MCVDVKTLVVGDFRMLGHVETQAAKPTLQHLIFDITNAKNSLILNTR